MDHNDPLVLQVYDSLIGTLNLPQALQQCLVALSPVIDADGVFVNVFVPEDGQVHFLAHSTHKRASAMDDHVNVPGDVARGFSYATRSTNLVIDDIREDAFTNAVVPQVIDCVCSYIMMRLVVDGRHVGVVCFYSNRYSAFTHEQAEMLKRFHNPLALVVGFECMRFFKASRQQLLAENRRLKDSVSQQIDSPLRELVRTTPSMHGIAERLRQVAPYDATVLITGESGVGKEVVANTLHQLSKRRFKPFVRINCASLPHDIIESELFGYEKGAFTDAKSRHFGIFEQAEGGTLFLDEIGELPLDIQVKLLRVLQSQSIRRLGGTQEIKLDVRIISETNRNLAEMVSQGLFRKDLYYRLNVYPIDIRPLRERPEDIEPLSELFLQQISTKYGLDQPPRLSYSALQAARGWHWPGNVRELRNVMARAVLTGQKVIESLDLSVSSSGLEKVVREHEQVHREKELSDQSNISAEVEPKLATFEEVQKRYFEALLRSCRGKISGEGGAAQKAGMHPNTLRSRLQKLGISIGSTDISTPFGIGKGKP